MRVIKWCTVLVAATSLGACGFSVVANMFDGVIRVKVGITTFYTRLKLYEATSTNLKVCAGDSGGTVYSHFSGGGESILGTASAARGFSLPPVNGWSCNSNLLFTYWGQGRAVFSDILPDIT